MNAPDTIYLQIHDEACAADCSDAYEDATWCQDRINDNDTAYVRADLPYELAKTVEAQKAEIARLREWMLSYGHHAVTCDGLEHYCTCGFTAALASPPAAEEATVQKRTKGSYGAECNRASCKTVLATWKHRDMDRYYCSACGMWINESNSDCDPPLCGPVSGDAT